MKVIFIYRLSRQGAYSIEEIFHTVANELRNNIEVVEYETGGRSKILRDIQNLRLMKADIYHVTGDVNYLVPLLPHEKVVLTVHDIGHYLYGLRGFRKLIYKWFWLQWPMRSARAVTTVSVETRRNILDQFEISGQKLQVIENCYNPVFKPALHSFNADCPMILQVGTKPYKNVPRLVEALQDIPCRLVLIGELDGEIKQKLEECQIDYSNLVNLTQEQIHQQYVACDIVSFVSIGEGFGVPIIEAQATGRPLISLNVSPLCDVAGSGAVLVDPLDVSAISEGIRKIISNDEYRNELVQRGLHNAERYAPATISGQYLKLYCRLTT